MYLYVYNRVNYYAYKHNKEYCLSVLGIEIIIAKVNSIVICYNSNSTVYL